MENEKDEAMTVVPPTSTSADSRRRVSEMAASLDVEDVPDWLEVRLFAGQVATDAATELPSVTRARRAYDLAQLALFAADAPLTSAQLYRTLHSIDSSLDRQVTDATINAALNDGVIDFAVSEDDMQIAYELAEFE